VGIDTLSCAAVFSTLLLWLVAAKSTYTLVAIAMVFDAVCVQVLLLADGHTAKRLPGQTNLTR
jgi:hypothetical protein